jgi:hypothetical protein
VIVPHLRFADLTLRAGWVSQDGNVILDVTLLEVEFLDNIDAGPFAKP